MSRWYYLLKGRPHGPTSIDEIKNEIASGRLGARDLLFQERDTKWREAAEYAELSSSFNGKLAPDGWVLLARKLDGSGYRQRGPFSSQQIISLLKNGEVSFTDYVWRKGLKEWYKILALPDFSEAFAAKEKSLPPLPSEPVLSEDLSEITMSLPMPSEHEEAEKPPPEAVPVDEAKRGKVFKVEKTEKREGLQGLDRREKPSADEEKSSVKKHIVKPGAKRRKTDHSVRRLGIINYYLSLSAIHRAAFVSVIVIIFSSALYFVGVVSSYFDRNNYALKMPTISFVKSNAKLGEAGNSKDPVPVERQESPQVEKVATPAAVEKVAAPIPRVDPPVPAVAVEANVKPTYLKFSKIDQGEESAKFKVISNGSSHYPIYVIFEAGAGQVLDARNVRRKIRLAKGVDDRTIDLSQTGLPSGDYDVTIESEGLTARTEFSFATKSPEFKTKLYRQRKQLNYFHNEERYSFFKTAARLEKEAYKLAQSVENAASLNSWTSFYRDWRKNFERIQNPNLKKINNRNRKDFVHAELWLELKDLQKRVDQEAKALNKAKIKKHAMDATDIRAAALDLTKLKERMLQASLWRKD